LLIRQERVGRDGIGYRRAERQFAPDQFQWPRPGRAQRPAQEPAFRITPDRLFSSPRKLTAILHASEKLR
jgi:hypothetical protein